MATIATREQYIEKVERNEIVHTEITVEIPELSLVLTNENFLSESMRIKQAICDSSKYKLGGCISSEFKIKVINLPCGVIGKRIVVTMTAVFQNNNAYPSDSIFPGDDFYPSEDTELIYQKRIFTGTVVDVKRQKEKYIKELVAYDKMAELADVDVHTFLFGVASYSPDKFVLGRDLSDSEPGLREVIFSRAKIFEMNRAPYDELINDKAKWYFNPNLMREKWSPKISAYDFLHAYSELNAVFAMFNEFNYLEFITCEKTNVYEINSYKAPMSFEDFTTRTINNVNLNYGDNAVIRSNGVVAQITNSYEIDGNMLCECRSDTTKLATVINNLQTKLTQISTYRPFELETVARLWLKPGDWIRVNTFDEEIGENGYVDLLILERTIKGIQGLTDTFKAQGTYEATEIYVES